jgi:hypothetical protein
MNDLVSEYQQYQDATAEGEFEMSPEGIHAIVSLFTDESEGMEGEDEEQG